MPKGYSWASKNFDVLEKRLVDEGYSVERILQRDLDEEEHLIIKTICLDVKSDNLSGEFYTAKGTLKPTPQATELNSKDERLLQLLHSEYRHKHISQIAMAVGGIYAAMGIGAVLLFYYAVP